MCQKLIFSIKMINDLCFKIVHAKKHHAAAICQVIISSIKEVCAPDYNNDKTIINEWLVNKTPENILKWNTINKHAFVALNKNNDIIGYSLMNQHGEILLNYVLHEYLCRGVGKALLANLERQAQLHEIKELRVVSTITAKIFYERNGFVKDGSPKYVGNILGDFPLKKTLSAIL